MALPLGVPAQSAQVSPIPPQTPHSSSTADPLGVPLQSAQLGLSPSQTLHSSTEASPLISPRQSEHVESSPPQTPHSSSSAPCNPWVASSLQSTGHWLLVRAPPSALSVMMYILLPP